MLQARSGIGRSNYMRSGDYRFAVAVTIGGVSYTSSIVPESLQITKSVGDSMSSARFRLKPGSTLPAMFAEVKIGLGSIDNLEFGGFVERMKLAPLKGIVTQSFLDVSCVDYRRLLNRYKVNGAWEHCSATRIAYDILQNTGFSTAAIEHGLANIDSFSATNADVSDLLRQLAGLISGGFYVDEYRLPHLYSGNGETNRQASAVQVSDSNARLLNISWERDGSQIYSRVVCEGKSTRTLLEIPIGYNQPTSGVIIPVEDHAGFRRASGGCRVGTQRFSYYSLNGTLNELGQNPPGTQVRTAAAVGATTLQVDSVQFLVDLIAAYGYYTYFIKVNNQIVTFNGYSYSGSPSTSAVITNIPASGFGSIATPIAVDAEVVPVPTLIVFNQPVARPIPLGSEVVLMETADDSALQTAIAAVEGGDGIHEHVVSDRNLDYLGAALRAQAELDAFSDEDGVLDVQWETRDLGLKVGQQQDFNMTGVTMTDNLQVVSVDLDFPSDAAIPPFKRARASTVKTAGVLDVVQTKRE